jgi:SNF2 family DNA or RNA helicase
MISKNVGYFVYGRKILYGELLHQKLDNHSFIIQDVNGEVSNQYDVNESQLKFMQRMTKRMISCLKDDAKDKAHGIYLDGNNTITYDETNRLVGLRIPMYLREFLWYPCLREDKSGVYDVVLNIQKMNDSIERLAFDKAEFNNQLISETPSDKRYVKK